MINFKFVGSQLKKITIPLVVFFVILLILIISSFMDSYLAPSMTVIQDGSFPRIKSHLGAASLLKNTYFGIPGFIVLFAFGIVVTHILVSKGISKGYFGSWLTMSLSRRTVINSKLFVLLSAILMLYGSSLIVQLIIFPIRFSDFKIQEFGQIVLYNFSLIILALFWSALNWIIICALNKASIAISLAVGISTMFVVFAVLVLVGNNISSMKILKNFKYLTFISLFNSPFSYQEITIEISNNFNGFATTIIADNLGFKALDFAWQLPLLFVSSIPLFWTGSFFIINKNLFL